MVARERNVYCAGSPASRLEHLRPLQLRLDTIAKLPWAEVGIRLGGSDGPCGWHNRGLGHDAIKLLRYLQGHACRLRRRIELELARRGGEEEEEERRKARVAAIYSRAQSLH